MLHGEKVILRTLREADFEPWYGLMNDDVELSLMGSGRWVPLSMETAREKWQSMLHASPDYRVTFAVEVDGVFIGSVSIKDIDRQRQNAWLSIVLGPAEQLGRGYGRDAIRTALRWAFRIHNLHRVTLETWATNERAIRCYHAAGFVDEGRMREAVWIDGQFVDVITMGMLRHEWRDG